MTDQSKSDLPRSRGTALISLRQVMGQLRDAVASLDDEQYTRKRLGVFDSSIGGHVRHCLDHAAALAAASGANDLDYDRRERETVVENDRQAALREFERVDTALAALADVNTDQPIQLTCTVCGDGSDVTTPSSIGREIVFVLSHTVHHNALIAGMMRQLGLSVASDFGFAPATLAYLSGKSCAQ